MLQANSKQYLAHCNQFKLIHTGNPEPSSTMLCTYDLVKSEYAYERSDKVDAYRDNSRKYAYRPLKKEPSQNARAIQSGRKQTRRFDKSVIALKPNAPPVFCVYSD